MDLVQFNLSDTNLLAQFYELSKTIYANDLNYANQINAIEEVPFVKGFMLLKFDEAIARGVLYRSSILMDGKLVFFIGHFEALTCEAGIGFLELFKNMFQSEYQDALLIGPVNGSTWQNYRLAAKGVPSLFPNDIVNPEFYTTVFEKTGFRVQANYYTQLQTSFEIDLKIPQGYIVSYKSKSEWEALLPEIYEITIDAFSAAPFFTQIEYLDFKEKYRRMLSVLDTNLMPLVYDEMNHLVGYGVAYLSGLNNCMTAKTIARQKGFRYAGVGRILSNEMMLLAKQYKVSKLFHAMMHQQNHSKVLSKKYGAENVKHYVLYKL